MNHPFKDYDILTCQKCLHTFQFSKGLRVESHDIFDEVVFINLCHKCLSIFTSTAKLFEFIDGMLSFQPLWIHIYLIGTSTLWRSRFYQPVIFI